MGRGAKEIFPEGRHTNWLEFIKCSVSMIIQQRQMKATARAISSEKENEDDSANENECGGEPGAKGIAAERGGNKTSAIMEADVTVGNRRITVPSSNSIPGPASEGMCKWNSCVDEMSVLPCLWQHPYNCGDVQSTQVSTNSWIQEWYIPHGVLLSHRRRKSCHLQEHWWAQGAIC